MRTSDRCTTTRPLHLLVLTLVLLGNVSLSGWWMYENGFLERPLPQEYAVNRVYSAYFSRAFAGGLDDALHSLTAFRYHHGPLLPISGAAVGLLIGDVSVGPVSTWITSTALYGSLLLIATYVLGRSLGLTPWIAIAATALVVCTPAFGCLERVYFQQVPMAAFVTLAIAMLIRSCGFTHVGFSALAGFFCGLSMLAKNIAPIYLAGPLLLTLVHRNSTMSWVQKGRGVAVMSFTLAAIVLPWLATSWDAIASYVRWGTGPDPSWPQPIWPRVSYHLTECINHGFGAIPTAVLLAAALASYIVKPISRNSLAVPLSQVLISYVALTLAQPVGNAHFQLSWMPVLALSTVECLHRCRARLPRTATSLALTLLVGMLTHTCLMQRSVYRDTPGRSHLFLELPPRCDCYLAAKVMSSRVIASPRPEAWPVRRFVDTIFAAPAAAAKPTVLTTHQFLCAENLRSEAIALGRDLISIGPPSLDEASIARAIAAVDYFIHDDSPDYPSLSVTLAWLADHGITVDIADQAAVYEGRQATLLAVRRPR